MVPVYFTKIPCEPDITNKYIESYIIHILGARFQVVSRDF